MKPTADRVQSRLAAFYSSSTECIYSMLFMMMPMKRLSMIIVPSRMKLVTDQRYFDDVAWSSNRRSAPNERENRGCIQRLRTLLDLGKVLGVEFARLGLKRPDELLHIRGGQAATA